jgi:succinoglycan biosynthesis transport protein ExoP
MQHEDDQNSRAHNDGPAALDGRDLPERRRPPRDERINRWMKERNRYEFSSPQPLPGPLPGGFSDDSSSEGKELSFSEYFAVLRANLLLIVSCGLFGAACAGIYCFITPAQFTAKTTVEIRGYAPILPNVQTEVMFGNDTRKIEYQKTTVAKLKLDGLADEVLSRDSLALELDDYWQGQRSWMSWSKGVFAEILSRKQKTTPYSPDDLHFVHRPGVLSKYLAMVRINPVHETNLVEIFVTSTKPSLSQRLANAHATAFIDHLQRERKESMAANLEHLQRESTDLKARVTEAEQALAQYADRNKLLTLGVDQGSSVHMRQIEGLAGLLATVTSKRIQYESLLQEAQVKGADELSVSDDEVVRQLRVTLKQAESERAAMASRVTPAFPAMVELNSKIEGIRGLIHQERRRITKSIQSQYEAEKTAEHRLREQIENEKGSAQDLSKRLIQYNVLSKEASSLRDLYQAVLKQVKEIEISASSAAGTVFVSDFAALPTTQSAPKTSLIITLFSIIGLGLGCIGAFLRESFDTSIKSPEEAQSQLGIPLLGSIPSFNASALPGSKGKGDAKRLAAPESPSAGVVGPPPGPHDDPSSPHSEQREREDAGATESIIAVSRPGDIVSEALRTIRASILLSSADNPPRVVMIASAMPGDGKTTVLGNLAATLAQASHKTIMIDGDLRLSSLSALFRPAAESVVGLTDVLTGHATLGQGIHATHVPGLDILPAGSRTPNPAELLGSRTMQGLIAELEKIYDFILIDTPPILAVADGLVVSRLVDSVVMVVRSHTTDRVRASEARKRLTRVNARILGVVLNDVSTENDAANLLLYKGYITADGGR